MKGIFTIFQHKKWVFAYVVTGLTFFKLDGSEVVAIMAVLIPLVLGASSFDKSVWRKDDNS